MNIVFINSKGFWPNGWLNTVSSLKYAMNTLASMGITVSAREVAHVNELEDVLSHLPLDTLVWPNAYYTEGASGHVVWIQELIEKYALPYVGTSVQGLKTMLDKTDTHQKLYQAGVPVPRHLSISRADLEEVEDLIKGSGLSWPIVVKPTAESCSMGVIRANNQKQAQEHIIRLFDEFPHSNALLETFLPNEDITCGYLRLGGEVMLLPTYYKSQKMPGTEYVMERDLGVAPWTGPDIIMPPVRDKEALQQLSVQMPTLAHEMGNTNVTRADARMDTDGKLRFFDVNGMPALSFPKSVLVRQVKECFPELSDVKGYSFLLNTLVMIAADQFKLTIPGSLTDQNLFSLDGAHVIRLAAAQEV